MVSDLKDSIRTAAQIYGVKLKSPDCSKIPGSHFPNTLPDLCSFVKSDMKTLLCNITFSVSDPQLAEVRYVSFMNFVLPPGAENSKDEKDPQVIKKRTVNYESLILEAIDTAEVDFKFKEVKHNDD